MTKNFARFLILSCVAMIAAISGIGFWIANEKASDAGTGLVFSEPNKVAAGEFHTLAIDNGKLFAWGSNQYGQVGNKTTLNTSYPVRIGNNSNWVSVAAGNLHSLAINQNGALFAWGQNRYGQLGIGNTTDKNEPTQVGSATNWVMAAAGVGHSIAINSNGEMFAWGLNDFGQLGNNTTVSELSPIQIGIGMDWTFVEAGYVHSYAINSDGHLYSWGANGAGQLGLGDTIDRHFPELIGEDQWKTVSAGTLHTLAVSASDDGLWAWGDNSCEQVTGFSFDEPVLSPSRLEVPLVAKAIAAGHNHTISIENGRIYAWGNNELGQFSGNSGDFEEEHFGSNFVSVFAGHSHTFVMDDAGILYAFGNNDYGQLGDGTNTSSATLKRIFPCINVTSPERGTGYSVSLPSVSELPPNGAGSYTFQITREVGYNPPVVVMNPTKGQLVHLQTVGKVSYYQVNNVSDTLTYDDFNVTMTLEEYDVSAPSAITGITVSSPSSYSVEYGDSYSFNINVSSGYADPIVKLNSNGVLTLLSAGSGDGLKFLEYIVTNVTGPITQSNFDVNTVPLYVDAGTTLSIGQWHSLTIINGEIWAWGNNSSGQLGLGHTNAQSIPARVGVKNNWTSIAVGELHSLALNSLGELYAWGNNNFGQLGTGDGASIYTPQRIGNNHIWVSIFASNNTSYAINSFGELWAWGNNANGQLGNGTDIDSNIPIRVGNSASWISVTGGFDFTLAIDAYGRLFSWGGNGAGQLGTGDNISLFTPTQVGTDTDWASVSAGTLHVLALKRNGSLYAWGTNESGQLGFGDNTARLTPVRVGSANNWTSVSAGHNHSLAANSIGELYAWGRNTENQFGNETTTSTNQLTKIGLDSDWAKVSAGFSTSIATKTNGKVYATGNNAYNQVGDGTTTTRNKWTNILPLFLVEVPNSTDGAIIDGSDEFVTPSGNGTYTFTIESEDGYTNGSPSVTLTPGKGTLGAPSKNGNVRTYTITNILDDIHVSDLTIIIPINISAPNSGTGYTVQQLSLDWVMPNASFEFTITKNPSYSNPTVTLAPSLGTISAPVVNGLNFTFTVSNIKAPISASDFIVTTSLQAHIVASPFSVDGYAVSAPSSTLVNHTESYTFTITKSAGYANPIIALNQNGSLALTSEVGNVLTYTVSNVVGQISSSDFTFTSQINVTAPTSATGYTVSNLSASLVAQGGSYTFVLSPVSGYDNKTPDVTLNRNGILTKAGNTYTVSNVTGPIIAADFTITVYVNISAPTSKTGFTVGSPAQNWVVYGGSYTFTITPSAGYNNKAPLVTFGGTMSQNGNDYTVSNVTAPIVSSDFTVTVYVNIAAPTARTGFTVGNLPQNWVVYGGSYTFTITPSAGYNNKAPLVTFGGTMSKDVNTYTVSNVTAPIVAADFTVTVYVNIAVPASGTGYDVSVLTQNWVEYNGSYTFTVTAQSGYTEILPEVRLMSLNGTLEITSSTATETIYTVKNVTGPITIADFTVTESINISAPASTEAYIVSNLSVNSVLYGGSYTFTVTPQDGYNNKAPLIVLNRNGTLTNTGNSYTVSNVTGPISPNDFTITVYVNVSAPATATGYSVNLPQNWVVYGGSYTFTITPSAGYNNKAPLVTFGGTMSTDVNTYTVSNVTVPIVASDFTVTVYVNIAAPTERTGFTVGSPAQNWVVYGGSYTFTITPSAGYTNKAPLVTFGGTMSKDVNTYTVSNVTSPIVSADFTVTVYFNVDAPASGTGYTVGSLSQNWAEYNGSYTFTITRHLTYSFANVVLNTSNGSLQSSKSGNVVTYTVNSVTGPIYSTDFSIQTQVRTYQITYRGLEDATAPTLSTYTYELGVSLADVVPSTRASHDFIGWSLTQNGAIVNAIIPEQFGDITLWANWKIKTFTASFDTRGGNTINSLKVEYGSTLSKPVDPYLTGFYFNGWETVSGTSWDFATNQVTENITLYANWTRLYFELSYNDVEHASLPNTHTYGTATTLPTPTQDNYDFAGWYIGNTKLVGGIIPANFLPQSMDGGLTPGMQVTITAHWTAHTYTITFENIDPNNTSAKQTKVLHYSELPYVLQPLEDTEYWLFKNWLDFYYVPVAGQTLNAADFTNREITVRGYWTARQMTVIFKSLDTLKGKFQNGTTTKTMTVPYNSFVTEEIPVSIVFDGVIGYYFLYWKKQNADLSLDAVPFDPNTTRITANITLIACWKLNTDAVKNILTQLGIAEETDIVNLEARYNDPAQEEKLNELIRLVKIALIMIETDRIGDREAFPADVKDLESLLIAAITALSSDPAELEHKMSEHTYLGYLISDLNAYKAHPDYSGWISEINYLLGKAGTLYNTFITDISLIDLTNMTDEIMTFFTGKSVPIYERDGYLRPEPPFTFANPNLILELQSLVDALETYTQNPLNAKLTEALSVALAERMQTAQTHLANRRVTNGELNNSITELTQIRTAIFEHLAKFVTASTLQDLGTTIQDAIAYLADNDTWSKIGTTLKDELDAIILEAQSGTDGYADPMLYQARALALTKELNAIMDKIDVALAEFAVWETAHLRLETLLAEIAEYLETMEDGLNKQLLATAHATANAILNRSDVNLQELTTAYYEAFEAFETAKNPIDVPPSNNNNDLLVYIIFGVSVALALAANIMVIFALKKKGKRGKKPGKPKPSDLIIKNRKPSTKLAWMSAEPDA